MILDDLGAIERVDRTTPARPRRIPEHCRRASRCRCRSRAPRVRGSSLWRVWAARLRAATGRSCAADTLDVPILVHRGYGLPAAAGREALVVALSYSGDTAEVLSAVDVALGRRIAVVAVTAGGALGALAQARGLPRVTLPAGSCRAWRSAISRSRC
jgi:hypothetical protein